MENNVYGVFPPIAKQKRLCWMEYRYKAYELGIKEQVVEMAINGSGIRDTARVLEINKNTVIST